MRSQIGETPQMINMVMAFTAPESFVMNNLKDRLSLHRIRERLIKRSITKITQIRFNAERNATLAQQAKFSRKE
ncbi:hypothetical protein HA466_0310700 [Hirschfeldia incana]|nr:hypothetical protein HA466_0310700 [Hirschfeldia incana]KAJ0230118.1 hypothetical protein HA466_0310700 [Hirschfeldia incana]